MAIVHVGVGQNRYEARLTQKTLLIFVKYKIYFCRSTYVNNNDKISQLGNLDSFIICKTESKIPKPITDRQSKRLLNI